MQTVVKVTSVSSYLSPAIIIVFLLIVAAVLLATLNYGMGAEVGFNQSVAVVMYASLPGDDQERCLRYWRWRSAAANPSPFRIL